MSVSLELSVQPDDWLDITSKEELLETELSQLRAELKKRTEDLEASNTLVSELEGHKSSLESERESLQEELKQSMENFTNLKAASTERITTLEDSLSVSNEELETSRDSILRLQCEVKDIRRLQEKERKDAIKSSLHLTNVVDELKNKLFMVEITSKTQKEELAKVNKELKDSRSQLTNVRKELAVEKKSSALCAKKLELTNKSLGIVAVLAEERKDDRFCLDRTIVQQKRALGHASQNLDLCYSEIDALKKEVSDVKHASKEAIKGLEGSISIHLKDLQETRDEVKTRKHELEAALEDLEDAREKIHALEDALDDVKERADTLETELAESRSNEEGLHEELEEQKVEHERRLDDIRAALGVKKGNKGQGPIRFSTFPFSMPAGIKLV